MIWNWNAIFTAENHLAKVLAVGSTLTVGVTYSWVKGRTAALSLTHDQPYMVQYNQYTHPSTSPKCKCRVSLWKKGHCRQKIVFLPFSKLFSLPNSRLNCSFHSEISKRTSWIHSFKMQALLRMYSILKRHSDFLAENVQHHHLVWKITKSFLPLTIKIFSNTAQDSLILLFSLELGCFSTF